MTHISNRTRIITLLLAAMILVQSSFAQYTVTKVIGHVTNKTTGEQLKPGTRLKDDDMLHFSSPKDVVRVIVAGKGIYIISPTPHKDAAPGMIVEMLKSTLKIKSREGYLSGRSEESALVPSAFETEGSVNNRILIAPRTRFLFDPKSFSVANGSRFFIQLEHDGTSPEIHALQTSGDTLIINPEDLVSRSQPDAKPGIKIGYYSREKNSSQSLSVLRPYVDTTGEMQELLKILIGENSEPDKEKLRALCYAEVYEAMGKPSAIDFNNEFDRLTDKYTKQQ